MYTIGRVEHELLIDSVQIGLIKDIIKLFAFLRYIKIKDDEIISFSRRKLYVCAKFCKRSLGHYVRKQYTRLVENTKEIVVLCPSDESGKLLSSWPYVSKLSI